MAVDKQFMLTGAKRVLDSRPMYAQVVVTDDCNLTCDYCDEYTPGGPIVPLADLKVRVDKLDELGVLVYDFLGGEPLLHPGLDQLIAHTKSKRGGSNVTTVITNGFFLGRARHRAPQCLWTRLYAIVGRFHRTVYPLRQIPEVASPEDGAAREACQVPG